MPEVLKPTLFGNPMLREKARRLISAEIASAEIQKLIADMQHTLVTKKYGVGLAPPQVGQGIALTVIGIKPTPTRPKLKPVELVVFNPEIVKTYGRRRQLWEGCISFGGGRDFPYAKALRWRKVRVRYLDEHGKQQEKDFEGLLAHLLQHETDHLNGVLFVDHVRDPKTWMMASEYKKRMLPLEQKRRKKRNA
jgi:peptide deformylase